MNAAGILALALLISVCCCHGKDLRNEFTVAAHQIEARFPAVAPAVEVTIAYHGAEPVTANFDRALKYYCHMESPDPGWHRQVVGNGAVVIFGYERWSARELARETSVQDVVTPLVGLDYFTRITAGEFTIPIKVSLPIIVQNHENHLSWTMNAKVSVSSAQARAYNDNRKKAELSQQFKPSARVLASSAPDRPPDIEFTLTYTGDKHVTLLLDPPLTDCLCLAERDGGELWALSDCEPHVRSPGKASVLMNKGNQVTDVLHLENYYKRLVTGERPLRYHFRLHVAYEGTDFIFQPLDKGNFVLINLTEEQVRAINLRADEWDKHNR
jgi:hypothetical protein